MFSLVGRTAVIAGGAGGLGTAVAQALSASGARVGIADLDGEKARAVAAGIDGQARGYEVDVTNEASVEAMVESLESELGPIDIAIPAAGVGEVVKVIDMTYGQWRSMRAVHLDGTFLCIRKIIPGMLERGFGVLVCFSSIASSQGVAGQVHYAAAKGGIDGLVRSLAREMGARGVRINAIAPGYFVSPLNDLAPPGRIEALTENVPLGRFGDPAEIGALAVYLSSDEAAYLTGQVISPNGGFNYTSLMGD